MKAEVEYMLKYGFAVPSQSPWSSPCLLVPKPDSTYRFCTDFRKVNKVTKADSFPLPRMEDCVDRVGNAKYVTKLYLLKGYWQVPLTQRASEISAFVTPDREVTLLTLKGRKVDIDDLCEVHGIDGPWRREYQTSQSSAGVGV
ncbi:uncharacterized protein LOC113047065 isoform X1 [Tachysurus ichikawai]